MTQGEQRIKVAFSNTKNTFPYALNIKYDSSLPKSATESPIGLETTITDKAYHVGANVSMTINVTNKK